MGEFIGGPDYWLDSGFDIAGLILPEAARTADGMVSERERKLAYLLARDCYRGKGFIIDGGMFLGSSGVSLAEGLLAGEPWRAGGIDLGDRKPMVGYELGVLPRNGPAERELTVGTATIRFGESFAPILLRNVAAYSHLLDVRIGDLLQETWNARDPIEIFFIDVAKTAELNQHVFEQFFPALIPGKSFIVQQDFFFDRLPWIKVLMGWLSEHFEWLGQVGPSSVYRYVKPIPKAKFTVNPYRDLPKAERLRLHALGQDPRLPERRRFAMDLSLAYLHAEVNGKAAGLRQIEALCDAYADYVYDPVRGASALSRVTRARRSMGLTVSREDTVALLRPRPDPALAAKRRRLETIAARGREAQAELDALDAKTAAPTLKAQA